MIKPVQIHKLMPQDAKGYLEHLQRKLDDGQIEFTDYLRQANILSQVDNSYYWQCLKCESLVLTNHADVSGIIFCTNCGSAYENGYLYPKEGIFLSLDNLEMPSPQPKPPYDYYKDIKVDETCPYCKKEIIEIGSWGGKKCPDKQCRFWQYHKGDFDYNESENAWGVAMDWLYD